jgi:hypothetical protein
MSNISIFESRIGKVACSADTFYSFITDIRNFRVIIPESAASNLIVEKDSCSFTASMLGTVTIHISEKIPAEKVIFSGNALQINDFQLIVKTLRPGISTTDIQIVLNAALNPFLKMVAAEPVKRLLEALVNEMEKFRGWNDIREHIQPL